MNTETYNYTGETHTQPNGGGVAQFSEKQLATGALLVVGGALLLRFRPVRSALKLGAMSAAGWAVYHHAEKSGWFQAPAQVTGDDEQESIALAAASQRLAEAWGAHYSGPAPEDAVPTETETHKPAS